MIKNDLMGIDEIKIKIDQIYFQLKKSIANCLSCNRNVLSKLCYTYCNSFVGSQVWDLPKKLYILFTVWNKSVRCIWYQIVVYHKYIILYILFNNTIL